MTDWYLTSRQAFYIYAVATVLAGVAVGLGIYLARRGPKIQVPVLAQSPTRTLTPATTSSTSSTSSPAPSPAVVPSGPKLSDASRIQLLTTYERALMYSQDHQRRQKELCDLDAECRQSGENTRKAVDEWNQITPQIVLKEKLPAGSGFNVDASTGTVNVISPAPTPGVSK